MNAGLLLLEMIPLLIVGCLGPGLLSWAIQMVAVGKAVRGDRGFADCDLPDVVGFIFARVRRPFGIGRLRAFFW